jgi:hypothetical protein
MFKREVSKFAGENYCAVVESENTEGKTPAAGSPVRTGPEAVTQDRRSEIFVLAANIYYRARRNTRARAAGIL